ncbi:hypothetical protein PVAND_005877 [Polypedilum vanderplanki]|uniref:Uncharacterized protein n=1 Tax=Polypedilum vanderplanki TaxID=319348 RepID=A0A9J6C3D0_POLVA|nr:hypothetical protein PVAND_005877 [Polypedilum vanderplanki]
MDIDDDNYSTDSSEREQNANLIVEVVEEEEQIPTPSYTEAELNKLLLYIIQIVTSYDLNDDDIDESFNVCVKKWLYDTMETHVFVYFDNGYLSASAAVPTCPVSQLTYFIREEVMHVFKVESFHDEVTFGTIHENIDETMLMLLHTIYIPRILKDKRWTEQIRQRLFNDMHSLMALLTDINSKIGSMVILYVPNEGHNMSIERVVCDKPLLKRYENVLNYWISQIQLCINDMKNINQNILPCPSDEYDFWVYKFEVFSGIDTQLKHKNIQHIINVLTKSQSLFIKEFNTLMNELQNEIKQSSSNAKFLKLLVAPCQELENSEWPKDVPPKLPKIIYLIRVISLNSEFYINKENTERLFMYLSNEIINYCKSKIDIRKILYGQPRFGIRICDMSIDCCLAYKKIFKKIVEKFQFEDFRRTWLFDESKIFSRINIFMQRLYDIMEICESIIVFGRCDETGPIAPLKFGCYNAHEFMKICDDIQVKFDAALTDIKQSATKILDVNSPNWYETISTFKKTMKTLEGNVESLLVHAFIHINNIEEALDILTAMYNFSKRKSLQAEYTRKVEEMWNMFGEELILTNKEITNSEKIHLACLPTYSGKSLALFIRMKKIERLKDILLNAHYLPKVWCIEEKMKMYQSTVENIMKRIESYHIEWTSKLSQQPQLYLSRFLINRSATHGGLLECNIDRHILPIMEEIKHFEFMEMPISAAFTQLYLKYGRYMNVYNKVVNVVLLHNRILCSLSDKERLLFKEHIMQMDRKISPGMFRLTYLDELIDAFISECLVHLEELQDFVDIYKTINQVIVKLFEEISNGSLQNINIRTLGSLSRFRKRLRESRNASVRQIGENYKKVVEYIITIYDGFESHLNTTEMTERWTNYVKKIDGLAEYAIVSAARNTLVCIYEMLKGRNNMKPDPIISVEITLTERKIEFEPALEEVFDCIKYIYKDLTKSIKIFPRLVEKFDLPHVSDIRHFYEVVHEDIECREIYYQINSVLELLLDKINDYVETWLLFRIVWEIEIEKFMTRFEENGLDLKEFENSMLKYYDVSNQVMMQDTTVVIAFLTLDCSKLKACVLEYIEMWKNGYKQTLCSTMIKKLEMHDDRLTSRIKILSEQPTNAIELNTLLSLHDQSLKEYGEREKDMDEIREYYKYLEKYKIAAPSTLIVNYENMGKNWNWYCRRLREIDDELYNFKEQFKMG